MGRLFGGATIAAFALLLLPTSAASPAVIVGFTAPYTSGRVSPWGPITGWQGCGTSVGSPVSSFNKTTGLGDIEANNSITACSKATSGGIRAESNFRGSIGIYSIPWKANKSFGASVSAAWTLFLKVRLGDYAARPNQSSAAVTIRIEVSVHDLTSGTSTFYSYLVWENQTSQGFVNKSLVNSHQTATVSSLSFVKGHWYLLGSRLLVHVAVRDGSMHAGKLVFASVATSPPTNKLDSIQVS